MAAHQTTSRQRLPPCAECLELEAFYAENGEPKRIVDLEDERHRCRYCRRVVCIKCYQKARCDEHKHTVQPYHKW